MTHSTYYSGMLRRLIAWIRPGRTPEATELAIPEEQAREVLGKHSSTPTPKDTDDFLLKIAFDVVEKQYRLYTWNDDKTQALITTNSILFAAVGFLYKECLNDTLSMMFLAIGIVCLGSSLVLCLIQVIPRLTSGRSGERPNTRSLRGISMYGKWEEYHQAFLSTTQASILTDTCRQIYGMVCNNVRSVGIVKRGVRLTVGGVLAIVGALAVSAIAARGHHLLGAWQIVDPKITMPPAPIAGPVSSGLPTQATDTLRNAHRSEPQDSLVSEPRIQEPPPPPDRAEPRTLP